MPKARATFTLDVQLLEELQKCARLQGTSVSSVVNDWLADTLEGLQYLSVRLHQERGTVRTAVGEINSGLEVMREGYAKVLDFSGTVLGEQGAAGRHKPAPDEPAAPPPRPVIRGVNSQRRRAG